MKHVLSPFNPIVEALMSRLLLSCCLFLLELSACSRKGLSNAGQDGGHDGPAPDEGVFSEANPTHGGTRVTGRVVAMDWGSGAARRTVVIGEQRVLTDADGNFSLDDVPATYDAMVVEPDGTQLSIYYGLTRRDPILSHSTNYDPELDDEPYHASIAGTLSGDFPFPLDANHLATAYYVSDRASASLQLSRFPGMSAGPDFGPLTVSWFGSSSVTGKVVVLGQYGVQGTPWLGASLASEALTLSDGGAAVDNLVLASVRSGNIAGTVAMYEGNAIEAIQFSYTFGNAMGLIALGEYPSKGSFDCALPDLSSLNGEYCTSIVDVWGDVQATKCGGQLGMRDFSFQVQAPPQIQKPVDGSPITKESKLSWTGVEGGVYLLAAMPELASPETPRVHAYLTTTELAWPDLKLLGVEFPVGQTYSYRVSAFLPYASMDALSSSKGPYRVGVDRQQLDSKTISLVLIR